MSKFCRKITPTLADITEVCKLYLAEEAISLNKSQFDIYISSAQRVYLKMVNNGSYTYGCFEKNQLLGVINVNKNWDYYPRYENAPYVHLETFIIKKEYQNKRIGLYLFENLINSLKQEGVTYIIMQSDNEYVQRIAQKVGFNEHSYDMRIDFTV